jgi:hypothetical protein
VENVKTVVSFMMCNFREYKEGKMEWACSTYWWYVICVHTLVERPERKTPFRKIRVDGRIILK